MLEKLEMLKKEIALTRETTEWIKKYTAATEENNRYIKFFIEYLDIIPESEVPRLLLLMDEFGISCKEKK